MDSAIHVHVAADRDRLSAVLWAHVLELADRALEDRDRFFIALSGGSLLDILTAGVEAEGVRGHRDWARWEVFWADERWVPRSHPESNDGAARRRLWNRLHIPPDNIHAMADSSTPAEAARRYESLLVEVLGSGEGPAPRLDLILLGLGQDGHTASLFPNHPALMEARRWVVPVWNAPKPPPIRLTLTLPVINRARNVAFVASGKEKAQIVARMLHPQKGGSEPPARRVRPVDGRLRWFMDREAAAGLPDPSGIAGRGISGTRERNGGR